MPTTTWPSPAPTSSATTSAQNLSSIPSRTIGSFPAPVPAALQVVAGHTSVPLVASTSIEAGLSAQTTTKYGAYEVNLVHCPQVLPVNNPGIWGLPHCASQGDEYGSFGGELFPSKRGDSLLVDKPVTSLNSLLLPTNCERAATTGSHKVSQASVALGQGIEGTLSLQDGSDCVVRFQQRGWTIEFELQGSPLKPSMSSVTQVIDLMSTARLPAAHGLVSVDEAGDGEHTYAYWVQDHGLYWVNGYRVAGVALALLGSVATALPDI